LDLHVLAQGCQLAAVRLLRVHDAVEPVHQGVDVVAEVRVVGVRNVVSRHLHVFCDFGKSVALAAYQLDQYANQGHTESATRRDERHLHTGIQGQGGHDSLASRRASRASSSEICSDWRCTTGTRATPRRSYRRPSTSPSTQIT